MTAQRHPTIGNPLGGSVPRWFQFPYRIRGKHPLAPDRLSIEWSPDGVVCTYVWFGEYMQTGAEFNAGDFTSTREDWCHAHEYVNEWAATGIEPDAKRWPGGAR